MIQQTKNWILYTDILFSYVIYIHVYSKPKMPCHKSHAMCYPLKNGRLQAHDIDARRITSTTARRCVTASQKSQIKKQPQTLRLARMVWYMQANCRPHRKLLLVHLVLAILCAKHYIDTGQLISENISKGITDTFYTRIVLILIGQRYNLSTFQW